ncbi:mechanosensitive ion channel [Bacillus sp. C1]
MFYDQVVRDSFTKLPDLLLALLVLLIGWIIAKIIANVVAAALKRTNLDNKLFAQASQQTKYSPERIISKIVYYILMVIVFIIFFNILSLNFIATPLVSMVAAISLSIPNILKAALILLLAWLLASTISLFIKKVGKRGNVGALLHKWNVIQQEKDPEKVVDQIAKIVFYLVLLLFLPAVLSALRLTGISQPFETMTQSLLAFVPRIIAAALIVFVGWMIAKIVRNIISNFLQSIGTDTCIQKLGLTDVFKGTSVSSIIGTIAFIFILIPTVVSALDQLNISGISQPAIVMLNNILAMLPNIVIAILLLLVGIFISKRLNTFITNLCQRLGVDSFMNQLGMRQLGNVTYSRIIGYIFQIFVVLLFAAEALQLVKLNFLVTLVAGVISFLPQLVVAFAILSVGFYLGNFVQKMLANTLPKQGYNPIASITKYTIIALAFFMALDQLGVAASIVNAAFILILGGLALAFGLAFGLGGKEFAATYLHKMEQCIEEVQEEKNTSLPENKDLNNPNI